MRFRTPPVLLGGVFSRDTDAGGYRVDHVYRADPDEPAEAAPLARPAVGVTAGDVITMVNGTPALSAPDLGALLRNQAGKQVLLRVKPSRGPERDVVAVPMTASEANDLRGRPARRGGGVPEAADARGTGDAAGPSSLSGQVRTLGGGATPRVRIPYDQVEDGASRRRIGR
jgi:hypothetical protein